MLALGFKRLIPLSRTISGNVVSIRNGYNHTESTANENQVDFKKITFWEKFKKKYTGKQNAWKLGLFALSGSGLIAISSAIGVYGPPLKDENGKEIEDDYSSMSKPLAYTRRTIDSLLQLNQSIQAPTSDKLLPDLPPPQYIYPKYTLVLEIPGILVHPDWTFKTGWRFKKRPALELFLQQVSTYYEVVAFTREQAFSIAPLLKGLDPESKYFSFQIFREATRYERGQHIKDLACLNRDLSKVIIIDWNPSAYKLQPQNAFHIDKWEGDESDKRLIDMAAFLRMIAMSNVDDVRPVLDYYNQFPDPLEAFREKHEQLMEENSKKQREQATRQTPKKGFFGSYSTVTKN